MDVLAWAILAALWLFGGAAFFDSISTKYKDVLTGWAILNIFVLAVAGLVLASLWALNQVLT